jgi:glycerol-3-phosphate dehydrogenase
MNTDTLIIGAGIIGCAIARELAKHGQRAILIDKNSDIALEASGANSAIVHAGQDPADHTWKKKMNLEGAALYEDWCQELQCDFKRCGAYIAAADTEELKVLDRLERQAKERNIPCIRLKKEELEEPNLSDHIIEALSLPTTAIITPWQIAIACAEEFILNGGTLMLDTQAQAIEKTKEGWIVSTNQGPISCKTIINCAGVYADDIARMAGRSDFSIRPRKGEYFILDHANPFVSRVIYPVPGPAGKGVLAVPTIHGNTLLGPNAAWHDDKDDTANTDDLELVKAQLAKTVKNIPWNEKITSFAGNRPAGNLKDFIIEENPKGMIQCACIESPGLSSAPAIAKYVQKTWFDAPETENWIKRRPPVKPETGKLVCRCEKITEAEIVDVIRRPAGAKSVAGVKKRCRPGMGACQGGFCQAKVAEILARELHIPLEQVPLKGHERVGEKLYED